MIQYELGADSVTVTVDKGAAARVSAYWNELPSARETAAGSERPPVA